MAVTLVEKIRLRQGSESPLSICLMGPTASGKTDLAVRLVQELPCDIISVDSALVYRGMDIGTAKPDTATLAQAPHRLIDLLDPAESYSAASFRRDALAEMTDIIDRGRIPLLVGGTMLYFRALLYGLAAMPAADQRVREELELEAQAVGWPALHRRLAAVDPATASRLKMTDSQRIQRALEVYQLTGKPLSQLHSEQGEGDKWQLAADYPGHPLLWGITPVDRAVLHQRIASRYDQMIDQGLVEEVRALHQRHELHAGLPAMRAVGYRQVWDFLEGRLEHAEMIERGIIATRQLAKRQLTWMRSWQGLELLQTDATGRQVLVPEALSGRKLEEAALDLLRTSLN